MSKSLLPWYKHPDYLFTLVVFIFSIVLIFRPTGFEDRIQADSYYAKAKIFKLNNSELRQNLLVKTGSQQLTVEILSGPFQGQTARCRNTLMGKMEIDEVYGEGENILVEFSTKDGKISRAYARGRYRIGVELLLAVLFGLFLIAVGGITGAKALLSFFFSGLMLWKVLIPCFLKGYDPILVALVVVALLTSSISFMVGGVSRKGLVTFLGAFLGLVLTCILAQIFTRKFHIHGAVRPFAETLLYSGYYHLDLTRIFIAGIFTASSGAVMDLAMDIAASMHEVKVQKPDISTIAHFRSGMQVGRAVIGTMTTTLLLAYSGSYIAMLMMFMGQGVPLINIANMNYVAAEVLNTLVGSFGLVTVAPFTALAGAIIYGRISPRIHK